MSDTPTTSAIYASDSPSIDAFCRWRCSLPISLFDSKSIYKDPAIATSSEMLPLFFDNAETSGSGTSTTYLTNQAAQRLSVSATTAGTRVRQTLQRFNYQSGKSHLILCTFNMNVIINGISKQAGYFDDKNGIFLRLNDKAAYICLRTYTSGSAVTESVIQSDWNLDNMNGTGPSLISLDWSKTQILLIDFEWLGVGRVRVGFVVDGKVYYAHEFLKSNRLDLVYMSTPNLPIRYEISNDGTGDAASLDCICCTVISEGGSEPQGSIRRASTSTAVACTATNTWYALVGIRIDSAYIGTSVQVLSIAASEVSGNKDVEIALFFNPTVDGTFTYNSLSQSALDIALGATANTVTNGYMVAGTFFSSTTGGNGASATLLLNSLLSLGSSISGTRTTYVLAARMINATVNGSIYGSVTWRESV